MVWCSTRNENEEATERKKQQRNFSSLGWFLSGAGRFFSGKLCSWNEFGAGRTLTDWFRLYIKRIYQLNHVDVYVWNTASAFVYRDLNVYYHFVDVSVNISICLYYVCKTFNPYRPFYIQKKKSTRQTSMPKLFFQNYEITRHFHNETIVLLRLEEQKPLPPPPIENFCFVHITCW